MIKRIFLDNWVPKVLSILLALLIWFVVSSGEQRVGSFPGGLEVNIVNVPEGLVATLDQDRVEVSLIAERSLWQRFTLDNFQAEIDLSNASEGLVDRSVTISTSLPEVEIVSIRPSSILVRLEKLESKSVPVDFRFEGDLASGFAPSLASIDPVEVLISGPSSLLRQVEEVIGIIQLNGQSEDFTSTVALQAVIGGESVSSVSIEPSSLTVELPVVRAANVKTVGIKVRSLGNLPSGLFISEIGLNPSLVSVTGSIIDLANLDLIETLPLDLSDIREDTEVDLALQFPDGITPIDLSLTSVSLTIEQIESSKTLSLFPNLIVNESNLISRQTPGKVEVEFVGPSNQVAELSSDLVNWEIDLTNFSPGVHTIELLPNQFSLPADINVSSINPGAIEIEIQ